VRLLIFIYSLHCGGAERVAANMANHWATKGWNVTLVTVTSPASDFYPLHSLVRRVPLKEIRGGGLLGSTRSFVHRLFSLRRLLRHVRPDVAVGMMPTANILLALARLGLSTPSVGSVRCHPPMYSLMMVDDWLQRLTYRLLDGVVVLTEETAQWLRQHKRVRNIWVIPNAVSWPLPPLEPRLPPASFVAPDNKVMVAVGRLEIQKGFDLLIEAFAPLATKHTDWILVVIGEGSQRPALEALIERHRLHGRVFLPGMVGNVGEWYETASLFVLSSRFEGFPNSLVEALASGVPAITFDCETGPRDIIQHGVNGLMIPSGDVVRLTDAMDRLMGDAVLRKRLGLRATEIREEFSFERIGAMWEKVFVRLMQT